MFLQVIYDSKLKKNLLTIIIFFITFFDSFSQIITITDTLKVNLKNEYKISSINIIPFTENILLGTQKLNREQYKINYNTGTFTFSNDLSIKLNDRLIITYQALKLSLKKEYQKKTLQRVVEDKIFDTIRVSKKNSMINSESIFGRDLQKSGSLIRGFTIGTNREFTLNSGLNLQLSGKLSDDINIVAALTDENIPIQPEGNTEKLDELDKVFIEIKHQNATATFGDYDFILSGNEFSNTTRKLQGLMTDFYLNKSKAKISVASSRGKFNINNFYGEDGKQGPYRLYGKNNERLIVVISNSEKVYLDGNLLKRGENNDYTIDYSNSEITFTPKKIITSASRIVVEFEYSDQKFKRNFFGFNFSSTLFDNLNFGFSYLRDSDDENNPIDFSLTDQQKNILMNAGNDRNKAVINGVELAKVDSLGKLKGVYVEIDTLINNQSKKIYRYSPGNEFAIYNVTFSFVGFGNGDYEKESLGKYKFVGIGQGSYLPIIFLPMPELKQLGNINLSYNYKNFKIGGEFSISSFDKNKLSTIDNSLNNGFARKLFFQITPTEFTFNNTNLGKISLQLKDRFLDSKYSPFDRIDNIEFNRDYNIYNLTGEQILREAELNYSPLNNISLNSKYGYLKQGSDFSSNRFFNKIELSFPTIINANYQLDYVKSNNKILNTSWLKQNGVISYLYKSLSSGVELINENKEEKFLKNDSLSYNSFIYNEISPFVSYKLSNSTSVRFIYSNRVESFPIKKLMLKQSDAVTKKIEISFNEFKEVISVLNLALRRKSYTKEFQNIGFSNNETVLIQSQNRVNLFKNIFNGEFYYNASTEQTARFEKVFVKVQKGSGNYIYLGDLNNNGIAEENEFQLSFYDADFILVTVPTDKLYPIIDLKTNIKFRLDFTKLNMSDNTFNNLIKSISTETIFRIDEQNKDEKTSNIYLLKLKSFLNEKNTLRGIQNFLQDINFMQNNSELSFRLRFNQRKSLNQYSAGIEKGYYKEKSLRIRFKMIEEISNQTDIINLTDNFLSPAFTNRSRTINNNAIVSEFSYRPENNLEIGFKFEISRSNDKFPQQPQTIDLNSQIIRTNLSFESLGRLRLEFERTEINSSSKNYLVPFEVLKGNTLGKNYYMRLFFDYKISSMIQTSLSYDLRKQENSKLIHNLRAEARAIF